MVSASAVDAGNYVVDATFTNDILPELVTISGLPTLSAANFEPGDWGVAATDGGGKIDGVWDLSVTNLDGFGAGLTEGFFIVDVKGTVKGSKGLPATVKMTAKGDGYVQTPNEAVKEEAMLSYSFTGTRTNRFSGVGPFTTNVTLIYLNDDGFTTNSGPYNYTYNPVWTTNVDTYGYPAYSALTFYVNSSVNESTNSASGTNTIIQSNEAYFDSDDLFYSYIFGTPVAGSYTNSTLSFTWVDGTNGLVTNVFNALVIGTNIDIELENGSIDYSNVTEVVGFDIAQMGAFINAYGLGRHHAFTNDVPAGNFVMRGVETNSSDAYLDTSTYTDYSDGLPGTTNSWDEIVGTVKGSVKSGKASEVLDGAARYSQYHYLYTTIAGTNGVIVFAREVNENGSAWWPFSLYSFPLKVVSAGKKLSVSSDYWFNSVGGLFGTGTINAAKTNYTASLKGKGFAAGASIKASGATMKMQLSSAVTNWITITNIAAFPEVSILASNINSYVDYTPGSYYNLLTNTVGTNVFEATSYYRYLPIPPAFANTNLVNVIDTFIMSGKVMGQQFTGGGYGSYGP